MNDVMTTDLLTIEQIFENRLFAVPDYQRGYSWEKKHLGDLIHDIERIGDKNFKHYTGTLVFYWNDKLGRYEIVDGQQRLTTLIILLEVIYEQDPSKYKSLKHQFIYREKHYVLETNEETKTFFRDATLGQKKGLPIEFQSLENLANAKIILTEWVVKNRESIDQILKTVRTKLGFLCFSPPEQDEIGIMFEVINNRGKSLSELEKIKNYFIYYASIHRWNQLREQVNTSWGRILKSLNRAQVNTQDEEDAFLRNCFILFYSTNKSKSWNVYDEIKKYYPPDNHENMQHKFDEISRFIDLIESSARYYSFLQSSFVFESEYQGENKAEFSKVLKRLRCHPVNASILPMYFSIMSYLFERPIDVLEVLGLLEVLNFRVYVLPNAKVSRSDSHQGALFQWAHELFWNRDHRYPTIDGIVPETWEKRKIEGSIFDYITMNLTDFTHFLCDEMTIVKSLTVDLDENIDYYDWNGLRYFLASYEEFLTGEKDESWDIEKILLNRDQAMKTNKLNDYLSKEHIWAQKNRVSDFPEKYLEKRRLGNFVLLGLRSNDQLDKQDISLKIELLGKYSSMSMSQVRDLEGYLTKAQLIVKNQRHRVNKTKYYYLDLARAFIDQRENDLIKFALSRWKLPTEKIHKFIKVDSFKAEQLKQGHSYFQQKQLNI